MHPPCRSPLTVLLLCTLQDQLDAQKAAGVELALRPGVAFVTRVSSGKEPNTFSPTSSSTKERTYNQGMESGSGRYSGSGRDLVGNRPLAAALWWGFHGSKNLRLCSLCSITYKYGKIRDQTCMVGFPSR